MRFWDFVDTATGGMVTDWQNGNKITAIAKGLSAGLLVGAVVVGAAVATGVVVGAAAAVATTAATAMMVASTVIGTGVFVAEGIPKAIETFKENYNKTLEEMERSRTAPPQPSADDKVSQLNNTAAPTYAAVDTQRLTVAEQQPPAEPVTKDPKELPVSQPAVAQQATARPAPAIRPA